MMKLQPDETLLIGNWITENGKARADAVCERIAWLIANHLKKVSDHPQSGAWETLYRDPADGRLWERTYPQGEMQGGGPPQLGWLPKESATQKYGTAVA